MLVLALVGAGVALDRAVMHPRADPLVASDAVVVLGGYGDDTIRLGQQLLADGVAPQLVVSNPYSGRTRNLTTQVCDDPAPRVTCFAPDPSTTLGEARTIRDLGAAQGWTRVTVVTGSVHVTRARYIVEKCWGGGLTMAAPPRGEGGLSALYAGVYQAAGFARAFLDRGC